MNEVKDRKDILILTDYRGLYRQGINRNLGIDLDKVKKIFEMNGYTVCINNYDQIVNEVGIQNVSDKIIFYTSSQSEVYRSYIDDIIYELGKKNILVPKYDMLKCHENKNYEEIYLKEKEIASLRSYVFAAYKDVLEYADKISYPAIVKASTGSGSISVYKVNNEKQLKSRVKQNGRNKEYIEYYLKLLYKTIKRTVTKEYKQDEKYLKKFIVQQFVPGLTEDWKVLVFGKKFYALNRKVRNNDFRASGSGKFSYIEPPKPILDHAYEIYKKMDVPFLSMDLCIDKENEVHLIEFQGLHFGPYTLINSKEYYEYDNGVWTKVEAVSDLSEEYAKSVVLFLKNME